jgi:hypothetical protein
VFVIFSLGCFQFALDTATVGAKNEEAILNRKFTDKNKGWSLSNMFTNSKHWRKSNGNMKYPSLWQFMFDDIPEVFSVQTSESRVHCLLSA